MIGYFIRRSDGRRTKTHACQGGHPMCGAARVRASTFQWTAPCNIRIESALPECKPCRKWLLDWRGRRGRRPTT